MAGYFCLLYDSHLQNFSIWIKTKQKILITELTQAEYY